MKPVPARKPAARKPAAPKAAAKPPVAADPTAAAKPKAATKPKAPAKPKTAAKAAAAPKTAAAPTSAAKPKAAAKPKTATRPKAAAKPKTASKPAAATRTAKAKAAVSGAAAAVAARLPDVKVPKVKAPELPEVTPARVGVAAGLLAGIGAAVFLWRSSRSDQPEYTVVEQDGDFEVRQYPATTTAAASSRGPRRDAMERNFRTLADYIFAKSRPGEKLAMTVPVTTGGSPHDGWTTRFFMPADKAKADLPAAPQGVTLETHPPRRVAAIRFSGAWNDDLLAAKEGALRSWLQLKNYPFEAKAEHAAYNSPMMPGPLRRNEMLVTLSEG
ncbi:MAG TPA: heme-binding protein [Sphingomonas sp.]|nr:heme-binding protein [Sphingomonas sp.]